MNLRSALKVARGLGCSVEPVRRTGELRVAHPTVGRVITLNRRRKDATRALVLFLKEVDGCTSAPTS